MADVLKNEQSVKEILISVRDVAQKRYWYEKNPIDFAVQFLSNLVFLAMHPSNVLRIHLNIDPIDFLVLQIRRGSNSPLFIQGWHSAMSETTRLYPS